MKKIYVIVVLIFIIFTGLAFISKQGGNELKAQVNPQKDTYRFDKIPAALN